MDNILVIHGFNSGPGEKHSLLQNAFPTLKVHSPQLVNTPFEDIKTLQTFIDTHKNIHVVGTSLGGFYTMILASMNKDRDDLYFYCINPLYSAYEHYSPKINEVHVNFKTKESFHITTVFTSELLTLQQSLLNSFPILANMYFYFGCKDTQLNHSKLKEKIQSFNKPYNILITNEDHRHNDLTYIIQQIKNNLVIWV
jgi:predicted esterase YcpF (UPF0227 family)